MITISSLTIGSYLASSFVAKRYADSQLFQPQPPNYVDDEHIIKLAIDDQLQISARLFAHDNPKATILFSHGNKSDIGCSAPLMTWFQDQGFEILIYDYPGYGTSDGIPTEQGANQAVLAAYQYLTRTLGREPKNIIAYGRSLGGGPTIDLAQHQELGAVIVEGTFTSVYRVKFPYPFLLFDQFENLKKAPNIKVPSLVIHGMEDEVIPLHHGEKLYNAMTGHKESLWLPDTLHGNVIEANPERYWQELHDFVDRIQAR